MTVSKAISVVYHSFFLIIFAILIPPNLEGYRVGEISIIMAMTSLLVLYLFLSYVIPFYLFSQRTNRSSIRLLVFFLFSVITGSVLSFGIYLFALIV